MERDFIGAFRDSTAEVLENLLKSEVRQGKVYCKSTALPETALPAASSLARNRVAQVYLDMDPEMARRLASAYVQQELGFDDDRTGKTLDCLAEAISREASLHSGPSSPLLPPPIMPSGACAARESSPARAEIIIPFETRMGRVYLNMVLRAGEDGKAEDGRDAG